MRLVFINQYYPPDGAPTGLALSAVVEELVTQGHDVTVICSKGGYTINARGHKDLDGTPDHRQPAARILRIWTSQFGRSALIGKLFDYLTYYIGVIWRLLWLPSDRIIALTSPPYLSVIARIISKIHGADHAHWVMDLYPDAMVAHGMIREGSASHRALSLLAQWGMRGKRCSVILTLGPDMADKLKSQRVDKSSCECGQISWVPLWHLDNQNPTEQATAKRRCEMGWTDEHLVIMYSGNMGLGHRFKEILELARQEGDQLPTTLKNSKGHARRNNRYVFFGFGKRRREIADFIDENPKASVELHDYAPIDILDTHLRSADVHIASLDSKWTGTMLPSKLQGIFAAGRSVIFIGDAESSIGKWVRQSAGGWIVAPGDLKGLRAAIDQAHDPQARESRGLSAKAFANSHFDRQTNVQRVIDILVC